jgi:hypothetical protein
MPTSVRVSVSVMALLAGLMLLNAGVSFFLRDKLVRDLVARTAVTEAEASEALLIWMIPFLVLGLVFALASWFVARRQAWARWMGLAASALVAMLLLIAALSGGGVSIFILLVFVLSLVSLSSLMSKKTATWVPRLGARRRAAQDG